MAGFFHKAGGGLSEDHPAYALRSNLDDEAFKLAINGELFYVLAPRQTGKTSLLKRLRARLQNEGWKCAIIDLSTFSNLPMLSWYSMLGMLLEEEFATGSSLQLTNQITMGVYLTREVLPSAPGIAVLFDEVEGMTRVRDEGGKSFSDNFFSKIRDLYQHRDTYKNKGRLVIGLAGAMPRRLLVTNPNISPFNVGHELQINDFTQNEVKIFTNVLAKLGVEVDDSIYEKIYGWTNGHPYLTHRICAELEDKIDKGLYTAITPSHIDQVVTDIFLKPDNPEYQDTNLDHAAKMLNDLSEDAKSVWERLRQGEKIAYGSVGSIYSDYLYFTGVIKTYDDTLTIRNRIYKEAFVAKGASEPVVGVKAALQSTPEAKIAPQLSYTLPSPPIPSGNRRFLETPDRNRIIQFIDSAINDKNKYGLLNMLANSHVPSRITDPFKRREPSADELGAKLELEGRLAFPHQHTHALGEFLAYLAEYELVPFDAAQEIVILIFKYNLILDKERVHKLSSDFQIPLPAFADPSFTNGSLRLAHLSERVHRKYTASQLLDHLESLYNKGMRHYNSPQYFIGGHKAINTVCRIEFDNQGEGTGFLVTDNLVLTNYHVFRPKGTNYDLDRRARRCQVRFGAIRDARGNEGPGKVFKLHQNWRAASSNDYVLDYLLLRLDRSAVDGVIAPVKFMTDTSALREEANVNIIHHPLGKDMVVSLRCNELVEVEQTRVYYLADTEVGSSGAPVFDDSWRVVALHCSGGERNASGHLVKEANAGIPIELIVKEIAKYLPQT